MGVQGPIWCQCKQHSWTRRQLRTAWEAERSLYCPNVECKREITLQEIYAVLVRAGILPEDEGIEKDD